MQRITYKSLIGPIPCKILSRAFAIPSNRVLI